MSNNHVFANSNEAQVGDAILQPAAMDGGDLDTDTVATLERFVRLRYVDDPIEEPPPGKPPAPGRRPGGTVPVPNGPTQPGGCLGAVAGVANFVGGLLGSNNRLTVASKAQIEAARAASATVRAMAPGMPPIGPAVPENMVDCALAKPIDPNMFSDDILGIGIVNETIEPALGMRVRKFGRTTSYTEANITLLNATVNVAYSTSAGTRTARFVGQVIAEAMSQGGDSGSLVVDEDENKAVGLLFAGSQLATIFTPIDMVLNALNITL
jgi:hypothetical protein